MPPGSTPAGHGALQGLGPFQRPEVAFQLIEIPPGIAFRPDRPPGPDGAAAIGYCLKGRPKPVAVPHGIGNPELAQPAPELPPLDGEPVGTRQQEAYHDPARVPIVGPAGLVQQPAAGYGVLCIEAGQSGLRAHPFDGETQPACLVLIALGNRAARQCNGRREYEDGTRSPHGGARRGDQPAAREVSRATAGKLPPPNSCYMAPLGALTPASL